MIIAAFILCSLLALARGASLESGKPGGELPDFVKICKRNDPNLTECIKASVEAIRPHLKDGIPELGIPPCEPLILPEIVINQGRGSVNVQSKYNDVQVHGPTDFQLQHVKVDLDKNKVKVKLFLPKLDLSGQYSITGKILMLPIAGKGVFKGNYTNIDTTAIIHGERVQRDGKTFVEIKNFFIDFSIGHASVHLSNLFDGDKQLGDSMNEFLNDNWKNVSDEMKPVIENTISNLFKKFAGKIFKKYPLETLLPEA